MQNEEKEPQNKVEVRGLAKTRVEAFSDGIFAVALPLLILEIHPWEVDLTKQNWWSELWPLLATCIFTFLIVGIYWIAHHNEFDLIAKVNRALLWLDLLFLLSIVLIPISTGLLGKYWARGDDWQQRITIWAYAGNLILTGLLLEALWLYAKYRGKLRIQSDDPRINSTIRRNLFIPITYAGAIGLSFVKVELSYLVFAATPILYMLWTILAPGTAKDDA